MERRRNIYSKKIYLSTKLIIDGKKCLKFYQGRRNEEAYIVLISL